MVVGDMVGVTLRSLFHHRPIQNLVFTWHSATIRIQQARSPSCAPPEHSQSANYPTSAMNLMRLRKGPIVGISKRISVPENFAYFAGGGGGGAVAPQFSALPLPQSQVVFQQRLLQLQQKRAAAAAAPAAMAPTMRHRSGSWSSRHAANKYLQHQVGSSKGFCHCNKQCSVSVSYQRTHVSRSDSPNLVSQ